MLVMENFDSVTLLRFLKRKRLEPCVFAEIARNIGLAIESLENLGINLAGLSLADILVRQAAARKLFFPHPPHRRLRPVD